MTARTFLVHGLLAGLLAGVAAFLVAHQVGEPPVEAAIALEEAAAADPGSTGSHDHGDEEAVVSRPTQRTWGLAAGTLAIGTALGGLVALVAAAAVGRLGRMTPRQSTAAVAGTGFVSFALVPFLKYPATPPAVGSAATIGERTALYFGFLLLSVVAAGIAVALAQRVWHRRGAYAAVLAGAGAYVALAAVAAVAMPTVDELGTFPASTLWSFRVSSVLTLTTLWGVLTAVLTGLVGRTWERDRRVTARRELAAVL